MTRSVRRPVEVRQKEPVLDAGALWCATPVWVGVHMREVTGPPRFGYENP